MWEAEFASLHTIIGDSHRFIGDSHRSFSVAHEPAPEGEAGPGRVGRSHAGIHTVCNDLGPVRAFHWIAATV